MSPGERPPMKSVAVSSAQRTLSGSAAAEAAAGGWACGGSVIGASSNASKTVKLKSITGA